MLAFVASAMISLVTIALWVRGHFASEGLLLVVPRANVLHVMSVRDGLYFGCFTGVRTPRVNSQWTGPGPSDDFEGGLPGEEGEGRLLELLHSG